MKAKITKRLVDSLEKGAEVWDTEVRGFMLRVTNTGRVSYFLRYTTKAGKERRPKLGDHGPLTADKAREKALGWLAQVQAGGDPAAENENKPADGKSVATVIADYDAKVLASGGNDGQPLKSRDEIMRTFRADVIPRLGERPMLSLTTADVVEMLDDVVARGSPFMANRLLAHFRALCNWCVPRNLVTVPPPTYMVKAPAKERSRERVLNSAEIRDMWRAAEFIGYPIGWCVQFMLVTGQREGECGGIHRGELDGEVWKLPPERTKNGREHWVPLTAMAREILGRVPRGASPAGLFFTGTGTTPISGWSKAKARIDKAMAEDGHTVHWVLHDLRHTVQTNIARLGFTDDVGDAVTNHTKKGMAGVYNRHRYMEEKREALEAWQVRLRAILAGEDFKEEGEA